MPASFAWCCRPRWPTTCPLLKIAPLLPFVVKDLPPAGRRTHDGPDPAPRRSLLASPLDKPNTVLILDMDSPVRLTHLGVERAGLSCVFLYLDSPHALVSALRNPLGMVAHT